MSILVSVVFEMFLISLCLALAYVLVLESRRCIKLERELAQARAGILALFVEQVIGIPSDLAQEAKVPVVQVAGCDFEVVLN